MDQIHNNIVILFFCGDGSQHFTCENIHNLCYVVAHRLHHDLRRSGKGLGLGQGEKDNNGVWVRPTGLLKIPCPETIPQLLRTVLSEHLVNDPHSTEDECRLFILLAVWSERSSEKYQQFMNYIHPYMYCYRHVLISKTQLSTVSITNYSSVCLVADWLREKVSFLFEKRLMTEVVWSRVAMEFPRWGGNIIRVTVINESVRIPVT
jgi:hypothetical protein